MTNNEPLHDRVVDALKHQYEVEREIGRGGMSVVYRARDLRLNRTVAVKVLPPELAYDPAVRTRFTREAQTAAHLSHPHIVPIFDVGEKDGIAYLVMALVEGGNLATLLAHEPRQPIPEVRRLLAEIADALAFAHTRGVVHRDIKPDNILLDRDSGRAMVTDFGIARAMEAGTRLTATGNAVGTPAYMSPEQAVGERQIDGRSDIYSLGVVAYQMVTGRVPFSAANPMALLLKHVGERPRPIAELRPETPAALADVIERALEKEPDDRWPNAGAMKEALVTGEVTRAPRASAASRRERPLTERPGPVPAAVPAVPALPAVSPAPQPLLSPTGILLEPEHLAGLTKEQRADLRLWHGRVNLFDRIKAMRGYAWLTAAAIIGGMVGLAGVEDFPPLIFGPAVPMYMSVKLWKRGKSLRESGLKLRRVLGMPRAKWVLPAAPPAPNAQQLQKLAPKEILEGPYGATIRRAAEDRAAIMASVTTLSKADRAQLPDIEATVNALVDRVAHLAKAVGRLDQGIDPQLVQDLDVAIADARRDTGSPDAERRLSLLQRQRSTIDGLATRRAELTAQIENAGLMLRTLRFDVIKLRTSGLQSALADVSNATREARALSRDIGNVLDAAAEVRSL